MSGGFRFGWVSGVCVDPELADLGLATMVKPRDKEKSCLLKDSMPRHEDQKDGSCPKEASTRSLKKA